MRLQGNKIHFTSLGCARNLVDTEVMLGILLRAGFEGVQSVEEADFLVVNTCGFLESAREESYQTIASLLQEKKTEAKLIVAGCLVQKHSREIKERFPEVHYLLGSGDMERILEAVASPEEGEAVTEARSYLEWGEIPRTISTPSHYAYLKIAEGCAKRCSFCIIPHIKGRLRSKSVEQILKEFTALLNQGVREIILIAQDLGDYAKDRKEQGGLERLLRSMLQNKGDYWLRLLYLYPDEITDELIAILEGDPRVCPYLDMPIQHINNEILKAMRRKTSGEAIIQTIEALRKRIPHIVIRTSLMVGFPGETEEQFRELIAFVRKYALDNVGIFKFSKEAEAHAATLAGHLPDDVKEDRFLKLAKAQTKVVEKIYRKYIGQRLKVLVEGYHPDSRLLMKGRFYGQCPEIDGIVILNDTRNVTSFGTFYEVEITDIAGCDLIGTVIAPVTKHQSSPLALLNS